MAGTERIAQVVAEYHHGMLDWEPDGCEQIGAGSQRTAYVDHGSGVVYKLGDDGANRREVRVLAEARAAGKDYAPDATLWTVKLADMFGEPMECTVVAMPYLPHDGSVDTANVVFPEAADLNPTGNVHANGGRLWLIDAGGI